MIGSSFKSGMSFMEIIVVIAIMALFAAVVGPKALSYLEKAKRNTTEANLRATKQALDAYYSDTGSFPDTLSDLMRKPFDEKAAKSWQGPYFDKSDEDYIPTDGWKHELFYERTPGQAQPYKLGSFGPEGEESDEDSWIYA